VLIASVARGVMVQEDTIRHSHTPRHITRAPERHTLRYFGAAMPLLVGVSILRCLVIHAAAATFYVE